MWKNFVIKFKKEILKRTKKDNYKLSKTYAYATLSDAVSINNYYYKSFKAQNNFYHVYTMCKIPSYISTNISFVTSPSPNIWPK